MRLAFSSLAALLAMAAPAWAQLPDPVDPDTVVDGASLSASGGVLGEATHDGTGALEGEVATVAAWTKPGDDGTEGFRGPRWTNRWGARMSGVAAAGSGDHPLALEERGEVALYLGSIGQTVSWQSRPRLTDAFWYRTTDRLTVGVFGDFCGIGVVKHEGTDTFGAEAFPLFGAIQQDVSGGGALTASLDLAVTRVAGRIDGRYGDLRLIDERVALRQVGGAQATEMVATALAVRRLQISKDSPWSVSADIAGLSSLTGFQRIAGGGNPFDGPDSIMPLFRAGIAHHGTAQLRAERSEIGRPVVDDVDFGAEVGTMHRMVEGAGIDEGGQALVWGRRTLDRSVAVRGEAMFAIADRVLVPGMTLPGALPPWVGHSELVYLARGELELTAQLAAGFAVQARVWAEHSERADTTLPAKWTAGVQSGVAWQM